jgi:hypothetical protein
VTLLGQIRTFNPRDAEAGRETLSGAGAQNGEGKDFMTMTKGWIAGVAAVLLLAGGLWLVASRGSDDSSPNAAESSVTTQVVTEEGGVQSTTPPQVSGEDIVKMIEGITSGLGQAVHGSGEPQALTPEQVEALLRIELEKLGIK